MGWVCPMCSTTNDNKESQCFVCDYINRKKVRFTEQEIQDSYETGMKCLREGKPKEAVSYLLFSAENKYLPAEMSIAECYRFGYGTDRSPHDAYVWYMAAARKGDPEAMYQLSWCCYNGFGTDKNIQRTLTWLNKAVEKKHHNSMKLLASILLTGEGGIADAGQAMQLYSAVFDMSYRQDTDGFYADIEALIGIAECHLHNGDKRSAFLTYKKAAEIGNAEAQYKVGYCYETGSGVMFRSKRKALKWYELAQDHGSEDARCAINRLKGR